MRKRVNKRALLNTKKQYFRDY